MDIPELHEQIKEDIALNLRLLTGKRSERYCRECGKRLRDNSYFFIHYKCSKAYHQNGEMYEINGVDGRFDTITGERKLFDFVVNQ